MAEWTHSKCKYTYNKQKEQALSQVTVQMKIITLIILF